MVSASISNGLEISLENDIRVIKKSGTNKILVENQNLKAKNVAICSGEGIKNFCNVKTKTSYAPIAVVSGVGDRSKSFVELDYYPKNCINLLTKDNGFGLAGVFSQRRVKM